MKFSLGMKIASLLSCVALVSMGFASWWIVQTPNEQFKEGDFTVYTVEEKHVTFSDFAITNSAIVFGTPSDTTITKWLIPSNTVQPQVLQTELSFTTTVTETTPNLDVLLDSINIEFDMSSIMANFAAAITEGVLGTPVLTASYALGNSTDYTDVTGITFDTTDYKTVITVPAQANATMKIKVGLQFVWAYTDGENTNVNPYTYYNSQTYTTDLASAAATDLTALSKLGTGAKEFKFTISTTVKGGSAT